MEEFKPNKARKYIMNIENILPADIEKRSMEIIESEIGDMSAFSEHEKLIVKRCVHTTADFD